MHLSVYHRGGKIAQDMAAGLTYLHGMGLVHGNLKLSNVLLTEDYTAKLGDFGFAQLLQVGNGLSCITVLSKSPRAVLHVLLLTWYRLK